MSNEQKLKSVLANVFNVDISTITGDASVDTIESWDSLNHLKLVLALEQEFDISFTEEQTVEIMNLPLIKMTLQEHGVAF
ncbi:MAG: acyl carrier protein [Bacteriovoracaceae bacterium]